MTFVQTNEGFSQSGNRALRLGEEPGHVSVPHSSDFQSSKFTFEGWFKRSSIPAFDGLNGVFNKGGASGDFKFWVNGPGFPQGLCFAGNDENGEFFVCTPTSIVWPNLWNHFAVTYDSMVARIYLDGKLVAADTGFVDISKMTSPLLMGEYISQFYGDMDNVRFWNVARTDQEIRTAMHQDLAGDEPGLIGYWQFNESSDSIVRDKTQHGNHGQIIGTAEFVPSYAPGAYVPPPRPKGFRGWGDDSGATLKWLADSSANIVGYTVYRSQSIDFDFSPADSIAFVAFPATEYVDTGLANGKRYYYRLRSLDKNGNYSRTTRSLVAKTNVIYDDYITAVAYYPWYHTQNHWRHPDRGKLTLRDHLIPSQLPMLGLYISRDPTVIQKHIEWSEQYGIDVWAVSWWGDLQPFTTRAFRDYVAPQLLGHNVKYCIFLEFLIHPDKDNLPTELGEREINLLIDYFTQLANEHFGHPNYFTFNGKPVVILYSTFNYFGDLDGAFARVREAVRNLGYEVYLIGDEIGYSLGEPPVPDHMVFLDAITWYVRHLGPGENGYPAESGFLLGFADDFNRKALIAETLGIAVVPNVLPGINARGIWTEEGLLSGYSPILARQVEPDASNTSTFEEEIRIMRNFVDPELKLIWITSWNEWYEDTQIEPTMVAPPTNTDDSQTGNLYTGGHTYEGYDTKFLEVVQRLLGGGLTAVEETADLLPTEFKLLQNYPNPFNPSTTISYQLPKSSKVNLSVYNVIGQLVETLVSERQDAGFYSVLWNTTGVPSGVYFYKIDAGEYMETKKSLILK